MFIARPGFAFGKLFTNRYAVDFFPRDRVPLAKAMIVHGTVIPTRFIFAKIFARIIERAATSAAVRATRFPLVGFDA